MASSAIESIMTLKVVSVEPDTPILEVVARMHAQRFSCIVVCVENLPVGIVSERDVVAIAASPLSTAQTGMTAGDFMSAPVTTIETTATVDDAIEKIQQARIRHLPVVDARGQLVGLVTQTDIVRAYRTHMEAIVAERTAQLAEANKELEALSREDGLLGIGNRRAMEESLAQFYELAIRYGRPYSIVLCDVDYFKPYNDRYGHPAGDQILKRLTRQIEQTVRGVDQLYRYGGEELLLILPETQLSGGAITAHRICIAIHELAIPHEDSCHGVVTISCGLAGLPGASGVRSWLDLVKCADQALYRAKREGRNRVSVDE